MTHPLSTLAALVQQIQGSAASSGTGERLDLDSNHLLHMDNRDAIAMVPPVSLDFVYIDPPFASNATYHQRIDLPGHTIMRPAYTDTWPEGISSYLEYLVPRLAAIRPLLKPTGSLCVHLDTHSSHYVRIALDALFGADLFINEVIWRYGKMSNASRRFPQNHDTLLVYGASSNWYFQPIYPLPSEYRARFARDLTRNRVLYGSVKHRKDKLIRRRIAARQRELGRELHDDDVLFNFDTEAKVQDDVITDIAIIKGNAREGVGYATQKPAQLLERLMTAFCPPGGVVADFFCGSGTTGDVAHALGRRWLLADSGLPAVQTARLRLQHADFAFTRAPELAPPTFAVHPDGRIRDFRLDDLQLQPADVTVVAALLATDADALLAGVIDDTVIDVFGREGRR